MNPGTAANVGEWRHAIARSDLTASARLVAHTLALYIPRDAAFTKVGTRKLETATGLARNTVLAGLKALREEGWLIQEDVPQGTHVVKRWPAIPMGGAVIEPLSGAMVAPDETSSGAVTDTSGAMVDTSGAMVAPNLRSISDISQRPASLGGFSRFEPEDIAAAISLVADREAMGIEIRNRKAYALKLLNEEPTKIAERRRSLRWETMSPEERDAEMQRQAAEQAALMANLDDPDEQVEATPREPPPPEEPIEPCPPHEYVDIGPVARCRKCRVKAVNEPTRAAGGEG